MKHIRFMFITKDPVLARIIYKQGVERIFIDWEVNGKQERQGHLDTVMSRHSFDDAVAVRQAVPEAELLIRLNPFYEGTANEVEQALKAGADLIMLPMFTEASEVRMLCDMVDGRAGVVPLFETPAAMGCVEELANLKGVHEVYIGLNDLHLALNLNFMFEPLANGMLESAASVCKKAGVRFGFGGVARANEGAVSGMMVLGEHVRLGSDAVIISRTFYRPSENEDVKQVFASEIKMLRECEEKLLARDEVQANADRERFQQAVAGIVERKTTNIC